MQIDVVWEELGPKIKDLLANGKSGVVASLLAACKRHNTHGREVLRWLVYYVDTCFLILHEASQNVTIFCV